MYQVLLIGSMLVGVGLIIYSLVLYSRSEAEASGSASNYFEAANTMKFVEASLEEIEKTMDELGEASKYVFEEMDKRYQELLILYSLIDQKKKEMGEVYAMRPTSSQAAVAPEKPQSTRGEFAESKASASPHIHKVRKLQEQGVSVEDTAKKLGIGKSEVQLLRDIGQSRA